MSNTATLVKTLNDCQNLYKMNPPHEGHEYVVSSFNIPLSVSISGPETFLFAATEAGTILGGCELDGSFRGAHNHKEALEGAGYEVVDA